MLIGRWMGRERLAACRDVGNEGTGLRTMTGARSVATRHGLRAGTVLLGVLAACGGGGQPSGPSGNPSNAVATVEVTPSAPTPFQGDTVRLTATPKNASGVALTGKAVSWTSNTSAVATVSGTGLVTTVAPGIASISAVIDGKTGSAQVTVQSRVAVDLAHQVTKQITTKGDSLTTTSAGTTYTLVLPKGALQQAVQITLTPLTSIHGLPFPNGLLAAVKLEPSGTRFLRPVTLRIQGVGAIPAGKTLIGFTAPDTGGAFVLVPAKLSNGVLELVVPHFSLLGAGAVLPPELAALSVAVPDDLNGDLALVSQILGSGQATLTEKIDFLTQEFERWLTRITPILAGSFRDDQALVDAIIEYGYWLNAMAFAEESLGLSATFLEANSTLRSGNVATRFVLGNGFDFGIARANAGCVLARDAHRVSGVLFWQDQAEQLGLPNDPFSAELSRDSVLANLCVHVIVTDSTLAPVLVAGAATDLSLRFGIRWGTEIQLQNSVFQLHLDLLGTSADGPVDAMTASDGKFTRTLLPTGPNPVTIGGKACLPAADVGADEVCASFTMRRGFGRTIVGNVGVTSDQGLASIQDVARIEGNLSLSGLSTTDLRELPLLREVTGAVLLISLPNLTSLSGLSGMTLMGGLRLVNVPRIRRPVLPFGVTDLPILLGFFNTGVDDLSGFLGLTRIGSLELTNTPVISLSPLQGTVVEGLDIGGTGLTSLAGLQLTPVMRQVSLSNNTALTDISALSVVTDITGGLILRGGSFTSTAALANLTTVTGGMVISQGTGAALYNFPALTRTRGLQVITGGGACPGSSGSISMQFPALMTIGTSGFTVQNVTSPVCPIDMNISGATVGGPFSIQGPGLRQLTVKTVVNTATPNINEGLSIAGAANLTSITFSQPVDVANDLSIQSNPLVTSIIGLRGTIRGNMLVTNNPLLSTSAINAWPLTVAGSKTISGNKLP